MVRPTDQEKTTIEKIVVILNRSQEKEAQHATEGHMGKHQRWSGGRGNEGETWERAFIVASTGKNVPSR